MRTEKKMPPAYTYCPTVFASAGNWKSYAAKIGEVFEKAAANQVKCAEKAREIVENLKNNKNKIKAIRNFVAKNIRLAGPNFDKLPLTAVAPADLTLKDGYGNKTDKGIVIYAMLKGAGLAPEFVLSSWISMLDSVAKPLIDFPFRNNFNDVLVRLKVDGKTIYLNDTGEYSELGTTTHDNRPCLILPSGKFDSVKAAPGKESKSEVNYKCSVSENGEMSIKIKEKFYGQSFADKKQFFAEMKPEKFKRYKEKFVSEFSQSAKLIGDIVADFENYPGSTELEIVIPKYAVCEKNYLYFSLPKTLGNFLGINSEARESPIYWSSPLNSKTTLEISLPDGFNKFELIPPAVEWEAPGKAGTLKAESKVLGGANPSLKVTYSIDFNPAIISELDYGALLTISRKLSHPKMSMIMVGKGMQTE